MADVTIGFDGLPELEEMFDRFPDESANAMRMAINDIASRSGIKLIKNKINNEIDFGYAYLTDNRLSVTRRATNKHLEAVITGRKRATSLARFASGTPASTRKQGVSVKVRRGKTTYIKSGWLVRLNKGASKTEDNFNVGLAVRVGAGEKIVNKKTQHRSWLVKGSVALLYAPSVDQVFRGVIPEVEDQLARMVEQEYLRQIGRLLDD